MSIDTDPRSILRTRARKPPARPEAPAPAGADPAVPGPPRMPGRRNPRWIALGVLALCLGALLAYAVYTRVATETSVVSITSTVYRGEVIEERDLGRVVIQGDSFSQAVPAAEIGTLVGKHAVFDLPEGSVVSAASVTDASVPGAGSAVVGLRLGSGRAPMGLLLPGSPVRLVALTAPDTATADRLAGKTYVARVVDEAPGVDGTSIVVNVEVSADQAPTIAILAAADRVAVIRDPGK